MDTPTTKKTWGKPRLMILSRATPDESVLTHCKRIGYAIDTLDAFGAGQSGCDKTNKQDNCGACQARAGS